MPRLVLHDYFRSSAGYRVRIALGLKGVDYERVPVNLLESAQKAPDYRAINSQGLVPTLEIAGERLTQGLAITDYLDTAWPDPPLLPSDPMDRAHVMAMSLLVACDIHPLNNLRVLKYLSSPLGLDEGARSAWYAHWVVEGLSALEAKAKPRAGRFLFGDTPGLADICLVPQLYNARRFDVLLDGFPLLLAVDAEAARIPAFADAHPDVVKARE